MNLSGGPAAGRLPFKLQLDPSAHRAAPRRARSTRVRVGSIGRLGLGPPPVTTISDSEAFKFKLDPNGRQPPAIRSTDCRGRSRLGSGPTDSAAAAAADGFATRPQAARPDPDQA